MLRSSFLAAAALGLVCAAGAQFPYGAPCWETDYGVPLNLADDQVVAMQVGFTFPRPGAGGTTDSVAISSNGFVWLDAAQTAPQHVPSVSALLNDAPRIAAAWMDLDPSARGEVYVHRFANRFVVTWNTVTYLEENPIRAQLQIYPDGSFSIYHLRVWNTVPDRVGPLVGVSRGLGAPDPGESNLSSIVAPVAFGPNVYEYFDPNVNDQRDLSGRGLLFTRDPTLGGFTLSQPGCPSHFAATTEESGASCPSAFHAMAWEQFRPDQLDLNDLAGRCLRFRGLGQGFVAEWSPTVVWDPSYGTDLGMGDDEITGAMPLGFTTSYFGTSTSAIEVCSNGFVNLESGVNSFVFIAPDQLAGGPTRVAMMYEDLDPTLGGSVHFRTVAGTVPYAIVTFQSVPLFATAWQTVTMQARFEADGDIYVSYGSNVLQGGLVGISQGHDLLLPPETDLTAALPRTMTGVVEPAMHLHGFPWPAIGTTIELFATELASSTLAVVAHLGVTYLDADLTFLGMPGCFGYATPDIGIVPMTIGPPDLATAPVVVPMAPALVGGVVYSQAFELAPGINPLSLGASNRLQLTIGY